MEGPSVGPGKQAGRGRVREGGDGKMTERWVAEMRCAALDAVLKGCDTTDG